MISSQKIIPIPKFPVLTLSSEINRTFLCKVESKSAEVAMNREFNAGSKFSAFLISFKMIFSVSPFGVFLH